MVTKVSSEMGYDIEKSFAGNNKLYRNYNANRRLRSQLTMAFVFFKMICISLFWIGEIKLRLIENH